MIIHPKNPHLSASTPSRVETTPSPAEREPLDRYTPRHPVAPASSTPPPAPRGSFWKGAAIGGGLAALGCLALGATGPLGWMVAGCAALVGGVHTRDGGISQEKLEHLEHWNRQLQDS